MTKALFILTGASRGMGLAMAQQLLKPDHFLLCISRNTNASLAAQAASAGCPLEQWPLDLEHSVPAAAKLTQWLQSRASDSLNSDRFTSATLINNAGVISALVPLSDSDPHDLTRALRVGLEAPLLLTAAFLKATEAWQMPRQVLNISSGLGRRAMASGAGYCAAKAGMDHFTRSLAMDEALKPHGAKVCSLAPGVIDTDMQVQLRSADPTDFPGLGGFVDLKQSGHLASPDEAARRVLAYLARPDFGSQPVADVRD